MWWEVAPVKEEQSLCIYYLAFLSWFSPPEVIDGKSRLNEGVITVWVMGRYACQRKPALTHLLFEVLSWFSFPWNDTLPVVKGAADQGKRSYLRRYTYWRQTVHMHLLCSIFNPDFFPNWLPSVGEGSWVSEGSCPSALELLCFSLVWWCEVLVKWSLTKVFIVCWYRGDERWVYRYDT